MTAESAQRLRVRYAKRDRMRFASHRDVARAMERAVRKAGLPIAYSAGFTPHPKISYAGAAATGMASEAEYLELVLTSPRAPEDVRARLDAALPDGIDVIDVAERGAVPPAPFEASHWQVTLPGVTTAAAQAAVGRFLAAGRVDVDRLTKNGMRRMDARAAVISLEVGGRGSAPPSAGYETLRMVVRHTTPAVRPDDILAALQSVAGLTPSAPPLVTRLAQVPLDGAAAAAAVPGAWGMQTRQGDAPGCDSRQMAGSAPASAHDEFPRGAADPLGVPVPGNLTGDNPDARERAEPYREHNA